MFLKKNNKEKKQKLIKINIKRNKKTGARIQKKTFNSTNN